MIQQRRTVGPRRDVGAAARAIAAGLCCTVLSVGAAVSGKNAPPLLQDGPPTSVAAPAAEGEGCTRTRHSARPNTRGAFTTSSTSTRTRRRAARSTSQPRPAHELRQVQPVHDRGSAPAGLELFMLETLTVDGRRRAADDVRAARRGDAGRARQVVGELPPQPEGAVLERRPGHRGRRQVQLRHR